MAGTALPTSIDEVDAGWLAEATGLAVESFEVEQIGVGIGVSSAVYRLHLSGEACPSTVVVKLPALDEAAVFTSTVLRMYIREVAFFRELAAESPIRVPTSHHHAVDEETSGFVVVMEDMGPLRAIDQVAGMAVADAERAADELARWHAAFWGRGEQLADVGLTVSLADPIYPAILPMVYQEGWEKVSGAIDLPVAVQELGPRYCDALPGLLTALSEEPTTMIHGDFRADNMLFTEDGTLVLLDFQLIGTGRGAYDLAYLITQSLSPEDASRSERSLFDRWVAGLRSAGVPEGDLATAWEDYRTAALFCLVYPMVASRGMDLDDPRQRDLLVTMTDRFARAADELELVTLL
jgi:Ser/Thr protein kinase RdoA (MazF antagonist)